MHLKPGTYRLRAEIAGFKAFVADNITVEGTQIRRFDIRLEVGGVSDQVTVAGSTTPSTSTSRVPVSRRFSTRGGLTRSS